MAAGYKTGGRKLGTPNKRTAEMVTRLEALKCDPVSELVSLAMDSTTESAIRVRCYIELLTYLYPKRKAIEVNVEPPTPPEPAVKIYDRAMAEIAQIRHEIEKQIEQSEAIPDGKDTSANADTSSR